MIMCTYKKICITNRGLAGEAYLERIEKVAASDVDLIILREKDLSEEEYEKLAVRVLDICNRYGTKCALHSFISVAKKLNHPYIHLPMPAFLELSNEDRAYFQMIGVSTHTVEEAVTAQRMGASYVTASHIFETKCKEGLAPKGLSYLKEVADTVEVDVYALGGIHPDKIGACIEAGADGICMMSEYMKGAGSYE